MGQKVNPIIFRISKTNNWKSKYFEKKSKEALVYNYRDIEIRKFIYLFFKQNGLAIHNIKLSYFNNTLSIFISYLPVLKTLSFINNNNKIQKIKLITKKLLTKII